jgi:hypothetical protein
MSQKVAAAGRVSGRVGQAVLIAAILALVPARSGVAQTAQERHGFWIGFGFGFGSAEVTCDQCGAASRDDGGAMFLKMGGTLSRKLLLGGELNGWGRADNGGGVVVGNTSAAVYFYPGTNSGLFFKGGLGFSSYLSLDSEGGTADGSGWGGVAGVGYDIRIGRSVSLTPVANFHFGEIGDVTSNGTTVMTGVNQNVFDIGLGITWH